MTTTDNYRPPIPRDPALYNCIKRGLYKKMPKHSAYRSGHLVRLYKQAYKSKYPAAGSKGPYIGPKKKQPSERKGHGQRKAAPLTGLTRWFAEQWRTPEGQVGYHSVGDIYRPTKRISQKTPVTYSQLTKKQIADARQEKRRNGRVFRFTATAAEKQEKV